jgi:phosphoenolpyruvate carboxylase
LQIAGHEDVLAGNPALKQWLRLQEPYNTALNVQQAYAPKKMSEESATKSTVQQNGQPGKPNKLETELVNLNRTSQIHPRTGGYILYMY